MAPLGQNELTKVCTKSLIATPTKKLVIIIPADVPSTGAVLTTLQWRHNERDGVSNHQPHDCLLNHLFRHRSKKTSKLRVNGLCGGNSPVTGEFPAQRASNAENVSIWWRHHEFRVPEVNWDPFQYKNCLSSLQRSPLPLRPSNLNKRF